MRIAYVAIHLESTYVFGGVGRKIQSQMQSWKSMGHEARLFLHSPDVSSFGDAAIINYSLAGNKLKKELARSKALSTLINNVKKYKPDVIYLRFGLFALPLHRLFNVAPVFLEINTDDVTEYRYRGQFFYWLNRLTRAQTLGRCAGLVPISFETANLPQNLQFHKPTCVIANGIDMGALHPIEAPHNPGPRLAYVGTIGIPWNGEDKLWELAAHYPDLTFDMIGFSAKDVPQNLTSNVILHGRVSVVGVGELLRKADVAIGTLALHRKNLEENSPLKVRESLGYGIPTIIAYLDTDLHGHGFKFLLELPNTEDNISKNMTEIHDFAYKMCGKRADRELLMPLIDQRVKEEKRLDFFKKNS